MSFTVNINKENILPVIHLKNEEEQSFAEVYAFGALLNVFGTKNSGNVINAYSSVQDAINNITNGFKSAKLSPFVCRIANGKYRYNGNEYTINKFYLGKEAIHGLLFDAAFSVIDSGANNSAAFVSLRYNYAHEDKGFPFDYACTITYQLQKNNQLSLQTVIKNNSDNAMPICDGWHPYFTLDANIDELFFQMNLNKIIEFNESLLPTGNILDYTKFQQQEVFSNIFLDNCFLLNDTDKPACVLKNKKTGLQLTVQPEKSYPYLQLYIPENRQSIAIENLSAVPDVFNNKMGLTILQPGETISFKTSYCISLNL